jgi:Multiubiquitin
MAMEEMKPHQVEILVNERMVKIEGPRATGLQIKQAAIAHGVPIQLDFVLSEELGERKSRVVGDHQEVAVTDHSRFIAVAPDDNS